MDPMNIVIQPDRKILTRFRNMLMDRKQFVFSAVSMCKYDSGLRQDLVVVMNDLETDIRLTERTIMELRYGQSAE
jgi:hypothetical protein